MAALAQRGAHGLLADDMGLGQNAAGARFRGVAAGDRGEVGCPRSSSARPASSPTGCARRRASRRICARSILPGPDRAAAPQDEIPTRRSRRHLLRHPAARHRATARARLRPGRARRGAAHQESRQPECARREDAARAAPAHPHRHAAGKLGARSLVALRFSGARLSRHRGRFPRAVRNAADARGSAAGTRAPARSACGPSSCAARRRKCCRNCRRSSSTRRCANSPTSSAKSTARCSPRAGAKSSTTPGKQGGGPRPHRRAHHAAAPAPGLLPSRSAAARQGQAAHLAASLGETGPHLRADRRGDRRRPSRAALQPVRADAALAARRGEAARDCVLLSRRPDDRAAGGDRPLPERRGHSAFFHQPEGRRHGAQPDRRGHGHPFRSVVESRRGGPGDRARAPAGPARGACRPTSSSRPARWRKKSRRCRRASASSSTPAWATRRSWPASPARRWRNCWRIERAQQPKKIRHPEHVEGSVELLSISGRTDPSTNSG